MTQPARFSPIDTETAQRMSAEEAIQFHYDNDTRFFSLWLDRTLSYSCARWRDPFDRLPVATDLAAAQNEKIRYHLAAAALPEGGRLIDIGCGWGAVIEAAVRADPSASALGLTLSRDQHEYISERAVPGVKSLLRDVFAYESAEPFDAAVSIGAFEHFARPQMDRAQKVAVYRAFFERMAALLTKNARFSLQTIVWDTVTFEEAKRLLPETVFPQSDIPFIDEIAEASAGAFRLVHMENDPDEYAHTLSAWIRNLKGVRETVVEEWGEQQYAFFELYLRRSRLAFKQRANSLARFVLVRR
ncbi:MAG: class I SAM-dependent methyltransferase [Pseudomonadota bacterium]